MAASKKTQVAKKVATKKSTTAMKIRMKDSAADPQPVKRRISADELETKSSTQDSGSGDTQDSTETTADTTETGDQATAKPISPVQAEDLGESVIVSVPRAFNLRITNEKVIQYPMGAYSMPKDHAEHWYSKANGVTVVEA